MLRMYFKIKFCNQANMKDKDNLESNLQLEDRMTQNFTTTNLASAGPGNVNVLIYFWFC